MGDALVLQDKELLGFVRNLPWNGCTGTGWSLCEREGAVSMCRDQCSCGTGAVLWGCSREPLSPWPLWCSLPVPGSCAPGGFMPASAFGNFSKGSAWKCFHAVPVAPPW